MSTAELDEYKSQLADVQALLAAAPDDPDLLSLQHDLLELIQVTTAGMESTGEAEGDDSNTTTAADPVEDSAVEGNAYRAAAASAPPLDETAVVPSNDDSNNNTTGRKRASRWGNANTESTTQQERRAADYSEDTTQADYAIPETTDAYTQPAQPVKKKKMTVEDSFVVPPHLIPLESDSATEQNKKRRALKALKNKWRAQQKEVQAEQKKSSWQSFQKKTKSSNSSSMFSTATDPGAKVGVVGSRLLTEFENRKRHK
jgi:hypothetical protein